MFTQSRPPSASPTLLDYNLQVYLQSPMITASKLTQSLPLSTSLCSLDHGVVEQWSSKADNSSWTLHRTSHGIWRQFVRKRSSSLKTVVSGWDDIKRYPAMMNHTNCVDQKCFERVREDQHRLCGSSKALQQWMRPRAGKDRVSISYNKMMSIYSGVSQIYTACHWVHLSFPRIPVCIYIDRLGKYHDVANLVTVTKTNMIDEMTCGDGTIRMTGVRIWHQFSRRACAEIPAALKVSHSPAQRFQQLQNLIILIINLVACWMHLHYYRCFQEHMRMLLQSLRALSKAPGGAASIWKYFEVLVRATGVSGRIV